MSAPGAGQRGGLGRPASDGDRAESRPMPLEGADAGAAQSAAQGASQGGALKARPGVMQVMLRDKAALLASYMPWLLRGGLFVQTTRTFALGDDIYLLVGLPDDPTRHPVAGKVVWITPARAGAGRPQGVGVAFPDDAKSQGLRLHIEALLGTAMEGSSATHTL